MQQASIPTVFIYISVLVVTKMLQENSVEGTCTDGDVRLINGRTPYEGSVQLCYNGDWEAVCDDRWDNNNTVVVCRQLGLPTEVPATLREVEGVCTGRYALQYDCRGDETKLSLCQYDGQLEECPIVEVKCLSAPECTEGEVRLRGDRGPNEGRVEFCYNGAWGILCGSSWDTNDATVVCRQLEMPTGLIVAATERYNVHVQRSVVYLWERSDCTGNESSLLECDRIHDEYPECEFADVAGVRCLDEPECNDTDVRLVGGYSDHLGRVEFCNEGLWGTICFNDWNQPDAEVVCRQLGLPTWLTGSLSEVGLGTGPIWLDYVACAGDEGRLSECSHSGIGVEECGSHLHDVGTACLSEPECNGVGSIRLIGGPTVNEGRVQICDGSGVWTYICDDGWDISDAMVACRQLGLHTGYPQSFPIIDGTLGYILWRAAACDGSESNLPDCLHTQSSNYNCAYFSHAGVKCFAEPECNDTDVRLVNGTVEHEGIVQICIHEHWAFVGGRNWNDVNAKVVCAELGVPPFGAASGLNLSPPSSPPILLNGANCSGSEEHLFDCQHDGVELESCVPFDGAAVVICTSRECNERDVRLRGGASDEYDGSVEVCVGGVWVTVCDDVWDLSDATVVCRQLGYGNGSSYPVRNYTGGGSRAEGSLSYQSLHLDNVSCNGTEDRLDQCPHAMISAQDCPLNYEAGVICTAATCSEGSVRVVGSYSVKEGRVEYCYNGSWYSVCADNWSHTHAEVVCSSLGYSTDLVSTLFNVGRGVSPLLPQDIQCSGEETQLSDCNVTLSDSTDPQCSLVTGVICEAPCLSSGVVDCSECGSAQPCPPNDTLSCQCTSDCFSKGSCCSDVTTIPNCLAPTSGMFADCENGDVRLAGGVAGSPSGRVEVCVGGVWGTVCDRLGHWTPLNTAVVCRQLSLTHEGAHTVPTTVFGGGSGPVFLEEVQCVGAEEDIMSCIHTGIGSHSCGEGQQAHQFDVALVCADDCQNGEVRLRDGTAVSNGRVEVCVDGVWGSVCSSQWDDSDATIVCSQLGFNTQGALATTVFGPGEGGPVFLSEVQCTGNETQLTQCPSAGLGQHNCGLQDSTGVFCDTRENLTRCLNESGQPPESQDSVERMERFGVCEPYNGSVEICEEVLTPTLNYVFISKSHSSQENISQFLDTSLPHTVISEAGDYCRLQIYRIVCNHYLAPCGSEDSKKLPPSSICPEECSLVENACPSVWEAVRLGLKDYRFLDCNDTSASLIPLPNCCTGVGIQDVPPDVPEQGKKSQGLSGGATVGITLGLLVAILTGAVVVVLVKLRRRKKKYTERMQRDILEIYNRNDTHFVNPGAAIAAAPDTEEAMFTDEAQAVSNMYSKMHGSRKKHRAPKSPYLRAMSRRMVIKHEQLTLLQHIGQGEFGIVYKANLTSRTGNKSVVAVKTLKGYFDQIEIDKIMEESLKMKRFHHPHVMSLVGVCLDAGPAPYIIIPYMANGSLQSYLKKERESLILGEDADEGTVDNVCKRLTVMCSQIADGMSYLADKKFIHRDLAARNCMIDLNFVIKITDFGLSEDMYARNYFRQSSSGEVVKLPVKWMAPESLSDGHFSEKSDVWSYGITLWEVFSGGKTPYPGVDPPSLVRLLDRGERMSKPDNVACNQEIYELMLHCWEYKPENRPTFKQLHSKTVSYIERIAGYLEMNFTIRNPQIIVTDTSAPEAGETADQPHSGNESDSSDNESEAF